MTAEFAAHQRIRREELRRLEPREPSAPIGAYAVELVGRREAEPIISRYEWLGTIGRANLFVGLLSPAGEVEGVAGFGASGFGPGPNGSQVKAIIGKPALCLERGACVHWAPPNAASFLIARACALVHRVCGVDRFFAYADPAAGEYGAVYQAANWVYLGQGINSKLRRAERVYLLPPGADPDDPRSWQTTRILGQKFGSAKKGGWSYRDAEAHGWRIEKRPAKHVYATCVGKARGAWLKDMAAVLSARHGERPPYPAPRPALKRGADKPASDEAATPTNERQTASA